MTPIRNAPTHGGGEQIVPVGPDNDMGVSPAGQSEGQILIAGRISCDAKESSDSAFSRIRLKANGRLEKTFGSGCRAIARGGSGLDEGRRLCVFDALANLNDGAINYNQLQRRHDHAGALWRRQRRRRLPRIGVSHS